MKQCINNTIQKYLEDAIKKYDLKDTESLYEAYKNIRTTMAEKGMIVAKIDINFHYRNYFREKTLTNPKTIAIGLLYIWFKENGYNVTQKDMSEHFDITPATIANAGKILEAYIEDNELELNIHKFERNNNVKM